MVIKPSEQIPATSALVSELIPKYLDNDLYHVVNGSVPETTKVGIPLYIFCDQANDESAIRF